MDAARAKEAVLLRFEEIAPGRDYHAALAADFPRRPDSITHTHDFSEVFFVISGAGTHTLNGADYPLRSGDLLWIRPWDCHGFSARPGERLYFINIAFRQSCWNEFRRFALEAPLPLAWEIAPMPPAASVHPQQRGAATRLFQETLISFQTCPSRLSLCRFWAEMLALLLPPAPGDALPLPTAGPPWLGRACLSLRSEDALKAGVPRLVELCGVSPAHLARTLKAASGQTPTKLVNSLRLEQAAILLTTTPEEIEEIADRCGFENLSYFYRLFRGRFGLPPRRFRLAAGSTVLPQ